MHTQCHEYQDELTQTFHERRCARLLQQAGLKDPQAAIEDFDTRPGRGIERNRFTGLALGDWITADTLSS